MGALADEFVRIRADTSYLGRDLKKEGSRAGGTFGGSFAGALKGVFAGAAIIGATKVLAGALMKSIMGASDLSETISKSNKIFGQNAKAIEDWSKKASKNLGLSQQEALEAAASFGDMFLQLGFAKNKADDMAVSVVQLSADLGSFNNLPTADVADRISAAFRGEYDSLQALVPTINAATVEKQALADTGKKSADQLTAEDKAAAVLKITFQQTKRAAGDFKDTQDGIANSLKTVKARLKDASDRIGKMFEPAAKAALQWFIDEALPAVEGFFERISKDKALKSAITNLKDALTTLTGDETFKESLDHIADSLPPIVQGLADIVTQYGKISGAIDKFEKQSFGEGDKVGGPVGQIIKDFKAGGTIEVALVHFRRVGPEIVREAWADIKSAFISEGGLVNAATDGFVARIGAKFGTLKGRVVGWVKGLWADAKASFIENHAAIGAQVSGFVGRIGTWFGTMKSRVVTWIKGMWANAKTSFIQNHASIGADVGRFRDRVVGFFTNLKSRVVTTATSMMTDIKGGITRALDAIRNAFSTAKTNIEKTWNGLKDAVSKPITWIKDNVYNKPLVPVWNRVAKLVGGTELKTYASGGVHGVRPGYTPGRDTHLIGVSGGEAIMRPEWTRAVGKDWIDKANKAARTGRSSLHNFLGESNPVPGFAGGGIVGWLSGLASNVSSKVGDLKDWALGGLRAAAGELLSPVKDLINKAMPNNGLGNTVGGVGKKAIDLILDKIKSVDVLPDLGGPAGSAIASGGWASIYRILRAAGARSFTTYAGHDQGASRSRDIWPPSQAIAEAARRLSSIWYVIYNRRIASVNYGRVWRPYNGSNPHTDHVHVTLRPGVAAAMGGIVNAAGGIDGMASGGIVRGGRTNWYGMGGVIREPVLGVGMRTGARYGFGERGPETVTPGAGGGRPITILIDMGEGLTQKVQGLIDDNDEFRAIVGRTR